MANYLDKNGLLYLWQKISNKFVAKETGKTLSTNDFTTELKTKLEGIQAGAQVNVKPDWNAATGNAAEILNKPTIPSKTSELQNDSGFITSSDIPEGAAASTTVPKMDGTAAVGTEMAFARGDHVHPSDTSKVSKTGDTMSGALAMGGNKVTGLGAPTEEADAATKKYVDDGLAGKAASDHNHDDAYLKLSGGQMTGPILFSPDQGQIAVDAETAAAKIELDAQAAEIIFTNKNGGKTNRMTVSGSGAVIAVGETTPGDGSGIQITADETNGVKIPMVATPVNDRDAANKKYVDDTVSPKANAADVYTKTEIDNKGFLTEHQDISGKADKATTLAGYGITDAYTKTELDGKLSSVYKPGGNMLFANLPDPSAANLGLVYSMNDAFTTDDRFIASEPTSYPIGTNVVCVQVTVGDAPTYLYDVLAGFVDLSGYMLKTDMVAITNEEIDQIVGDAT